VLQSSQRLVAQAVVFEQKETALVGVGDECPLSGASF